MAWEIYKGKTVELYILKTSFRYSGKCIDIADGFIIMQNDRDGRIFSFRLSEVETIKEVQQ